MIGNSKYRSTIPVDYAYNDAQLMKNYLVNVLGFKPANVIFLADATKADFEKYFGSAANHRGAIFNMVKANKSDLFVFYSGHGAPGMNDKKCYLVPVDCDPNYIELQGYSVDILYANLAETPTKSLTVVVDACFSGQGIINEISRVIIKPKKPFFNTSNAVLLTSSSSDEPATWLNEQEHGLFTYFFLKSIHNYKISDSNSDGSLTFDEIFEYISDSNEGVPYFARRLRNVEQHPQIIGQTQEVFIHDIKK